MKSNAGQPNITIVIMIKHMGITRALNSRKVLCNGPFIPPKLQQSSVEIEPLIYWEKERWERKAWYNSNFPTLLSGVRESYSSKVKGSFRTLENISLLLELLWSLRKQDPVILSATMATKKEQEGEKYVLVWRNWYAEVVICHRPWSLESKEAAGDGWLNIGRGRRKEAVQWNNWCWAGVLDSHTPF